MSCFYWERAKALAPHLSERDLLNLSRAELDTTPLVLRPDRPIVSTTPHPNFIEAQSSANSTTSSLYLAPNGIPIAIDGSLPLLKLSCVPGAYPTVSVQPVEAHSSMRANYYFEFDTSPKFDSPNLWRYPALLALVEGDNSRNRNALSHYVLTTTSRRAIGTETKLTFPFRPTAMCLPHRREDIGYNHLEAVARTLGNGLDPQKVVQEIYEYVHLNFAWGRDTVFRPPLDVLRAGIGGCGHMNILLGLLLELNGIRCRGVAGFDPVLREIYPGAGHSSIEFLNAASNKWEYLDAYLDIHLKGRAACDLPDDPIAQNITIADVGSEFDHMRYGAHINIARIFRYRLYFDFAERLPMASMLRLGPREDAYGRTWRLITTTSRSQVHAAEPVRTLYVRARYIVGQSAISTKHPVLTIAPVASEWTYGKIYF